MDTVKKGAVLQRAATGKKLPKSLLVYCPKFRSDGQNRFGFGSKIKCVFRLVIVDPVHAVAIIEERRGRVIPIGQETVEPAIQMREQSDVRLVRWPTFRGRITQLRIAELLSEKARVIPLDSVRGVAPHPCALLRAVHPM